MADETRSGFLDALNLRHTHHDDGSDTLQTNATGVIGGSVTIADGDDETFGAKADAAATTDTGTFTFMALFKRLLQKFTTQFPASLGQKAKAASLAVTLASDQDALPVTDNAGSLTVDSPQLPAALTGSGNFKTAIQEALPSGSNIIGSITGNTAHDAVDANNPVKIGGYAKDTAPTDVSDADRVNAWFKRNGAMAQFMAYGLNKTDDAVAAHPPATSQSASNSSAAYAASLVVKASAGKVLSISVYSSLASAQWIQIHNATSLPANGVAPLLSLKIAATDNLHLTWPVTGLDCSTGIVICNSTTGPNKTIGAADCYFTVEYL